MEFESARAYISELLREQLKPSLYYHSYNHAIDVLEASTRIAKIEEVDDHDMQLIKTAALFHDSGMINTYKGHEEASTEIAKAILPKFNYKEKDIAVINKMIMATMLPQHATNKLEMIICDADLDYLGRDDFFMISHRLKLEWHEMGQTSRLIEWYKGQIEFLEGHHYFLESTKELRQAKKEENLAEIKELFC